MDNYSMGKATNLNMNRGTSFTNLGNTDVDSQQDNESFEKFTQQAAIKQARAQLREQIVYDCYRALRDASALETYRALQDSESPTALD